MLFLVVVCFLRALILMVAPCFLFAVASYCDDLLVRFYMFLGTWKRSMNMLVAHAGHTKRNLVLPITASSDFMKIQTANTLE